VRESGLRSVHYVLLVIGCFFFCGPLVYLISTVFKSNQQVLKYPPEWIPHPVKWSNFSELFDAMPMWAFIKNSVTISVVYTLLTVVSCSLVAFAFARIRARSSRIWFVILLATMMIPGQITLIPVFIIFKWLNWIDTPYPLTVPAIFGNAFYIFLLRQFYMTLPKELDEAATIDGAGIFRIYYSIITPLTKPALITVAIFSFVGSWTDFYSPLIYLTSIEKMTLSVGITFLQGQYVANIPLIACASLISILPIALIYGLAQRYFVEGISLTGIKG
jgi:multiple sugar transport system permease protein